MKKEEFFNPARLEELDNKPLTETEIIEGNKLLLKFMDLDSNKSDEWLLNCGLYDKSWNDLMDVARRIYTFGVEGSSEMNGNRHMYIHMMFHQVLERNEFYRRTVRFAKAFYEVYGEK